MIAIPNKENDMGVKKGGDNMGEEPKAIPIPPYMSRSPKGQIGE